MKHLKKIFFLLVILYMCFFVDGGTKVVNPHTETEREYKYLSLFSEVVSIVKTNYVEAIDASDKFPGAFSSMLGSLDPFSSYLDASKTRTYRAYLDGKFDGCGIYGAKVLNYFLITDVTPGSTADRAGIKPGNTIKSVNGEGFYSVSFWEMYLSLLSPEPRPVEIVLFENNRRDTKRITLQTEPIESRTTIRPLPNQKDIFRVNLTRFDDEAVTLLRDRITRHREAHPGKTLKLIIDLRRYTCGDFNAFKEIVNLLFKKPLLVTIKFKDREEDFLLGAEETVNYNAVVIINRSTRMYAELLASLFRNSGAPAQRPAALVGTTTQGFVSKLKHIQMEDGSSILLTEGLFLLDGKSAALVGINPDIVIKDDEAGDILDQCISILNSNPDASRKRFTSVLETGKNDKKKTKK
jgi:carboxyl-terminal processing protease